MKKSKFDRMTKLDWQREEKRIELMRIKRDVKLKIKCMQKCKVNGGGDEE